MRKSLSMVVFVGMCLVLLATVLFGIYSVIDIFRILTELANDPTVSGIDYFGLGMWYGLWLFALSFVGLILSVAGRILVQQKRLQLVCNIVMLIFILPMLAAVFVFYM